MMVKFITMIQNLGANQNSWAEKIRLKCYTVLASESEINFKRANKLVSSIQKLHKDFRTEEKKLTKFQNLFEEKVKELRACQKLVQCAEERKRLHSSYSPERKRDARVDSYRSKRSSREDDLLALQLKLQTAIADRKTAEKDLEKHVCFLRGWQNKFNILLSRKLDELEKNETERVVLLQQTIKIFIAICREIAVETVQQLDSLQMEIDPFQDNVQFVKTNRIGTVRPPLHTPGLYYEQTLIAEKRSFKGSEERKEDTSSASYRNFDAKYTKLLQMILGKDKT